LVIAGRHGDLDVGGDKSALQGRRSRGQRGIWNGLLVTILNMAANLVTEYYYDRYFVFGKTIDTNGQVSSRDKS
jgi:hypothetical protein